MDPITIAIAVGTASLVGTGAVLIGGGKGVAKLKRGTVRFYDRNMKGTVDRWLLGTRPKAMICRKLSAPNAETLEIQIRDFSYYDAERVETVERYLEQKALEGRKPNLEELDYLRTGAKYNLKRPESLDEEAEEPFGKPKPIEYYDITLKIKNSNIRVGEIDFANWDQREDCEIIIRKKDDTTLTPDDLEYDKVLKNLKKYTKTKSLMPNDVADKAIGQAAGDDWLGLLGFRDLASYYRAKIPLLGKYIGDSTRWMTTDTDGGVDPRLKEALYIGGLIQVASEKAAQEEADFSILENYFEVRKQQIKNDLYQVQIQKISLENEVKARKKEAEEIKKSSIKKGLIKTLKIVGIIIAIAAALTLITAVVAAAIYGIGPVVVVAASVGSFALSAAGFIWSSVRGIFGAAIQTGISAALSVGATTALSLGFAGVSLGLFAAAVYFKGIPDYKTECLEGAERDLKTTKENKKAFEEDLEEVEKEKLGATKTLKAIREFRENPNDDLSLDLSFEMGSFGFGAICTHIASNNLGFSCEKLILRNAGVTTPQAAILAEILKKSQKTEGQARIHKIDLKGNPINQSGMEAILDSLKENCTLTNLQFDASYEGKPFHPDVVKEIQKELLLNRYLQGDPLGITESQAATLFQPKNFKEEAIIKIRRNFDIMDYTSSQIPPPDSLMRQMVDQNRNLAKLRMPKTQTTARNIIDAFAIDSIRCMHFVENKLAHNKVASQKEMFLEAITENPEELLTGLSPEQCGELLKLLPLEINVDVDSKILFIARMLESLHEDKRSDVIKKEIGDIIKLALKNNQHTDDFYYTLHNIRTAIAKTNPDAEVRRLLLLTIDKAYYTLNFPDHPEIEFIQYQLKETLRNHSDNPKESLDDILSVCKKIPEGDFDQVYTHLTGEEKAELLKLVQKDIDGNQLKYEAIKTLSEGQSAELLRSCRQTYYNPQGDSKDAWLGCHGVAVMAAKLIQLETPLDENSGMYVWRTFDWGTFARGKWSFNEYISELKKARDQAPDIERKLEVEEIIQAGLKADILYRLSKSPDATMPLGWLKEKLEEHYDLTRFNFEGSSINPSIQEYIEYICRRNILKQELTSLESETANENKINAIKQKLLEEEITYNMISNKTPLVWIKGRLRENYDITKINFVDTLVPPDIKEYIEYICNRNKLKKLAEAPKANLSEIIEKYKAIPAKWCEDALKNISNKDLLLDIQYDLASREELDSLLSKKNTHLEIGFKYLMSLDSTHRIALLENCFSAKSKPSLADTQGGISEELLPMDDANTDKKAILISGLIDLLPELKKQNDNDCRHIMHYLIYWAVATSGDPRTQRDGLPYYRYSEILNGSEGLGWGFLASLSSANALNKKVENMPDDHPLKTKLQRIIHNAEHGIKPKLRPDLTAHIPPVTKRVPKAAEEEREDLQISAPIKGIQQ